MKQKGGGQFIIVGGGGNSWGWGVAVIVIKEWELLWRMEHLFFPMDRTIKL